jgi:hypothetical protein
MQAKFAKLVASAAIVVSFTQNLAALASVNVYVVIVSLHSHALSIS